MEQEDFKHVGIKN